MNKVIVFLLLYIACAEVMAVAQNAADSAKIYFRLGHSRFEPEVADISFEWAADDHPGAPSPEGITVLVYDESGRPTEVFLSPSGGSVNFGEGGVHSMLLYNNDTESVIISGESHGPLEVCATSTPGRRTAKIDRNRYIYPPSQVLTTDHLNC